jgi:predicted RNase H-like HicB family nuclease
MVIGPAIDPKGKTVTEITDEVEEWIENTVSELPKNGFSGPE